MNNIEDHKIFVKNQMEFHLRQVDRYALDKRRSEQHSGTAAKFRLLLEFLEETDKKLKNIPIKLNDLGAPKGSVNVAWDEVQGLPAELLEELSISDSDKSDYAVVTIVEQAGGIASLDRILVEIYKDTNEIVKRANLNARIYRMIQKEMLFSVPGKKGVYSTAQIIQENQEEDPKSNMIG